MHRRRAGVNVDNFAVINQRGGCGGNFLFLINVSEFTSRKRFQRSDIRLFQDYAAVQALQRRALSYFSTRQKFRKAHREIFVSALGAIRVFDECVQLSKKYFLSFVLEVF